MLDLPEKTTENLKEISEPAPVLTDKEFHLFRDLIYQKCAINLKDAKKSLVANRLSKRLKLYGFKTYKEYYNYLLSAEGHQKEFFHMVDHITTNKTEFFRSQDHFEILANQIIPELLQQKRASRNNSLRIWSAGCSSGEEPYSLAIVLYNTVENIGVWNVKILATDISTRMLDTAKDGIYKLETIIGISQNILKAHFLKGEDKVKVKDHLKKIIEFRYLNLAEPFNAIHENFDIIFCRNVIIYFDRETQRELMAKFYDKLNPGGYLFLGHSESLHTISDQFRYVSPSLYQK